LYLFEGGGAGWTGGYYALMAGPVPVIPTSSPSKAPTKGSSEHMTSQSTSIGTHPQSIKTNTLAWGYEKEQEITLPYIPNQCYYLQFSYATNTEDYPALLFSDSYDMKSLLHNNSLSDCTYWLNTTISFASFCLPATPYEYTTVTFYGQNEGSSRGQAYTNLTDYWINTVNNAQINHPVGECFLALSYISRISPDDSNYDPKKTTNDDDDGNAPQPTSPPISSNSTINITSSPSRAPSIAPSKIMKSMQPIIQPTIRPTATPKPTTSRPTSAPTHFIYNSAYNFSGCFADCVHFPSPTHLAGKSNSDILGETCVFLLHDVYHTCDSFAIAYGYCDLPSCIPQRSKEKKTYCTRETWCYYAISSMNVCVSGNESTLLDTYASLQLPNTSVDAMIYQSCIKSYSYALPSMGEVENGNTDTSGNTGNSKHATRVALTSKLNVIAILILFF
jgi:hypothetical protein